MNNTRGIDDTAFLTPEKIAEALKNGFSKRMSRAEKGEHKHEVFVPEPKWFESEIIKKWAMEDMKHHSDGARTIAHEVPIEKIINCNGLADEWMRWALTNPVSSSPFYGTAHTEIAIPFLFKRSVGVNEARVYMTGISAFKYPDVKRLVITEKFPILVPVYTMSAAIPEQLWKVKNPGQNNLMEIVIDDLCGIYELEAKYDNSDIVGCMVMRNDPLPIFNVPRDNIMGLPVDRLGDKNSISICHGGLYLLLNPESSAMRSGEHLLTIMVKSINYEIYAKVHISVLAA
jgi:hypothetical protein